MKNLYLFAVLFFIPLFSFAQSGEISGKLQDDAGEAVAYANVILYETKEVADAEGNSKTVKEMVKVEVSGDEGEFLFTGLNEGEYSVGASYVGYSDYDSGDIQLTAGQKYELGTVSFGAVSEELVEVTVSATRPILEVKPDKLVFNVEGSVNATGNDGLEILRKAPGVVIDNNDNISLAGKSGVRIFIDGKPSPLRGSDLAAYLRSLTSDQIDNVEIITNPSAKYDAEGNAGIINIRLKKAENEGANATINAGYSIGLYARYNAGFNVNYRNKNANIFGGYGYNGGDGFWDFNSFRDQGGIVYDQRSRNVNGNDNHNFKFGTDFFLNDKNTIGFMVNGNINDSYNDGSGNTEIYMVGNTEIDSVLVSQSIREGDSDNYSFNVNYRFDNRKQETWNVDADYAMFRNDGWEYQPNAYMDASRTETFSERNFYTESPNNIDIATFKIDYERPIGKGQFGAGVKTSYVVTDNTFNFYNEVNGVRELDINQSSQFEYTENVNAAYVNYARQFGKFNVSAGVRMEQTNSKGVLTAEVETENDEVVRNYVDFFPSGGVTFSPSQKHSLQLTYSRRLDRPNYQNLNPFENRNNELTSFKGNPFLRPQYTNNVQLSHTFNYRYTTSFSFSKTKDLMTRVTDADGNKIFLTWLNVSDQYNYSLTFSAPITITKWWSSYTSLTGFHMYNRQDADGEVKAIDLKVTTGSFYTQHTFNLPWDMKFELSGWASSPSVWGGVFRTDAMFSIDAGLQKKFNKGKGNIRVGVSDIFRSSWWSGSSEYGTAIFTSDGGWDSRRFKVNMTYFIGNDKVKSRRRKTGSEDETKRTGGGGQGN